jgi:hypothetical protein
MVFVEGRAQVATRVLYQSRAEFRVRLGDPLRSFEEPIAVGILTKREENLSNRTLDSRQIESLVFSCHNLSAPRSR